MGNIFVRLEPKLPGPRGTVFPGPSKTAVQLTLNDVVEVAAYADAPVGPDPGCLDLVPYIVPASAVGTVPSWATVCRVGPGEALNYQVGEYSRGQRPSEPLTPRP